MCTCSPLDISRQEQAWPRALPAAASGLNPSPHPAHTAAYGPAWLTPLDQLWGRSDVVGWASCCHCHHAKRVNLSGVLLFLRLTHFKCIWNCNLKNIVYFHPLKMKFKAQLLWHRGNTSALQCWKLCSDNGSNPGSAWKIGQMLMPRSLSSWRAWERGIMAWGNAMEGAFSLSLPSSPTYFYLVCTLFLLKKKKKLGSRINFCDYA